MAASIAKLKERGFDSIPPYGVEPIDVPGAVGGWMAMHERFGRLPLEEVMAPAIDYAENGYPVSPNISRLWEEAYKNYSKYRDRPEFKGWFDTFAPNDTWLRPGDVFKSHDMAETLREDGFHIHLDDLYGINAEGKSILIRKEERSKP